jgi:hypothetical protein
MPDEISLRNDKMTFVKKVYWFIHLEILIILLYLYSQERNTSISDDINAPLVEKFTTLVDCKGTI